jgi:hypothetical protein
MSSGAGAGNPRLAQQGIRGGGGRRVRTLVVAVLMAVIGSWSCWTPGATAGAARCTDAHFKQK